MAISTITLANVVDTLAAKGIADPRNQPSGYNAQLLLELGNQVMAALITPRFNHKFNRGNSSFATNAFQQDYPLPAGALSGGPVGWGEECDIIQINSSLVPKPLNWDGALTWRRQLPRTSLSRWRPRNIAWMYNEDLTFGVWPGANATVYALVGNGAPAGQNPLLNFVDANGNLLVLANSWEGGVSGHTGNSAPSAPADSEEGVTVSDGTLTWEVVDPASQGFRLDWCPATGQTFQIVPWFQMKPPRFAALGDYIEPIPDDFSRHFFDGMEMALLNATADPAVRRPLQEVLAAWAEIVYETIRQGDKEQNAYGMVPAQPAVETRWAWAGPITADNPFGNV
jgi:hypothetical protein